MAVNKVVINRDGTEEVLIDISDSTVTPQDMPKDVTAYGKDGEKVTGSLREFKVNRGLATNGEYVFFYDGKITSFGSMREDAIFRTGSNVSVDVDASKFGDATAEDVVKGKTFTSVGGVKVEGTYEPLDTSDATAEARFILDGETAYVNGEKITGTMPNNDTIWETMDGVTKQFVEIPTGYTPGGVVMIDNTIKDALTDTGLALMDKGIDLPDGLKITEIAGYIDQIEVGGIDTSDATATSNDMAVGVTAYVNGEKVTGALPVNDGVFTRGEPTLMYFTEGEKRLAMYTFNPSGKYILNPNAAIALTAKGEEFGDATAEDVAKGKTFTSVNGLKVEGTSNAVDTSDATATAATILKDETAYVNGQKITGTCTYDADTSDANADPNFMMRGISGYAKGKKVEGALGGTNVVEANDNVQVFYVPAKHSFQVWAASTGERQILQPNRNVLVNWDGNLMGDATAEDVVKGKTFTSVSGLMVEGTYEPLDTSDATATSNDMAEGVTAYVGGQKVTGTLPFDLAPMKEPEFTSIDGSTFLSGWTTEEKVIIEPNMYVGVMCDASEFGDAAVSDVAKGKTFTSVNGLKLTGTKEDAFEQWTEVYLAINDGTYKTKYNVGDTIPLDLGDHGIINMQIAGIDVDDLSDGSGKAPITWIAKELLPTAVSLGAPLVTNADGTYQDGTGYIGGWGSSNIRRYLNDTILPAIPSFIRSMIKPVNKTEYGYNINGQNVSRTTEDTLWIPGSNETSGTDSKYYSLFQNNNTNLIRTTTSGINHGGWWTRTSQGNNIAWFKSTDGSSMTATATVEKGIVLCFCTGATNNTDSGSDPFEPVKSFRYSVDSLGTTYGFAINDNGYYESQNKGVKSSFAICRVNFEVAETCDIVFDVINYAESNYDYGLFGNLDIALTTTTTVDSSVKQNFKTMHSASVVNVTYSGVTPGNHFVDVKFIKDNSQDKNNDSIQFKVQDATSYLSQDTIEKILEADSDLIPGNIKSGVDIFGVIGTFEGSSGGGGGGLPAGITALATDTFTPVSDISNSLYEIVHGLGVVPNFFMVTVDNVPALSDFTKSVLQVQGVRRTVGVNAATVSSMYVSAYEAVSAYTQNLQTPEINTKWTADNLSFDLYSYALKAGYTYRWICGVAEGLE